MTVAVWSISTVGVIGFQANRIAGDDPFCLAFHKANAQITTFVQLRGVSFYATVSGESVAHQWDFYGLLIVGTDDGPVAYNWSTRRANSDEILQPSLFLADPLTVCTPQSDIAAGLFVLKGSSWAVKRRISTMMSILQRWPAIRTAHDVFVFVIPIDQDGVPIGAGFGVVFGAFFWLSARLSTPAAFMVVPKSTDNANKLARLTHNK